MSEEQKNYEAQDQQNQEQFSETKKKCLSCCCDYLKWSVKAGCKLFECAAGCA